MINKQTALIATLLCAMSSLSYANDFVEHFKNRPVALPTKANQIQVLNFWASWCAPCRKEMPEMSRWYKKNAKKQKVTMIGIAIDQAPNITQFLKTTPVSYPIWRYTGNNSRQLMQSYGNKTGGFPFTVVGMTGCETTWTTLGELSIERLEKSIQGVKSACLPKNKLK